MAYNSTIRQKAGICPLCTNNTKIPLIKGLCHNHYWASIKMKSIQKQEEKELSEDEDLQTLVHDLDIVFSRYIRLKNADLYGRVACITCGDKQKWTLMDNGHFISRSHMYTRFSEMNCHPQCPTCNRNYSGNLAAYAAYLEKMNPGSVEILQEHARIVYKYTKEEIRNLISEYSHKLKQLQ